MFSFKTLWILLVVAFLVLGIVIYLVYFFESEIKVSKPTPQDQTPSETIPAPEQIIVPPPDYGADQRLPIDESQPEEETPSESGQPAKVFTIIRSGKIVELDPNFIKLEAEHKDGSKHIYTALLSSETKIYLVTIPKVVEQQDIGQIFQTTEITLQDLQVGEKILVTGLANHEDDLTFQAYKIEKDGFR